MVNPVDAAGAMFGVPTNPQGQDGARGEMGRLFSSILLVAGRDGCACKTCKLGEQLAQLMVDQAPDPFPEAPPGAGPAEPAAAPTSSQPPAAPATVPVEAPPPAQALSEEPPGA